MTCPRFPATPETEETATEKGLNVKTLKLPLLFSGRYQAENEGGNGIMKLVLDEEKRILGACMLGNPASEIIPAMAVAITQRMTAADLAQTVFKAKPAVLNLSLQWISYDDLAIRPDAYDELIRRMTDTGLIQNAPAYEDFVDPTLLPASSERT